MCGGVVDENVDAAESRDGFPDGVFNIGGVGNVALNANRLTARRLDLRHGLVDFFRRQRNNGDLSAFLCKAKRNRLADAAP